MKIIYFRYLTMLAVIGIFHACKKVEVIKPEEKVSLETSAILESISLNRDGLYKLYGRTLRAGDPAKTGEFSPIEMTLTATGNNSVAYTDLQVWADNTGIGIGLPQLNLDPTTNLVTISSAGGAINTSAAANYYNPVTKTFFLDFNWGDGADARRAIVTLQYLSSFNNKRDME
ncbi:MAG: hypothetical protein H0W75_04150 [Chitinophagaceae bacterium]|nr:hypothetical protein [Chitinophagaceae bacterium]